MANLQIHQLPSSAPALADLLAVENAQSNILGNTSVEQIGKALGRHFVNVPAGTLFEQNPGSFNRLLLFTLSNTGDANNNISMSYTLHSANGPYTENFLLSGSLYVKYSEFTGFDTNTAQVDTINTLGSGYGYHVAIEKGAELVNVYLTMDTSNPNYGTAGFTLGSDVVGFIDLSLFACANPV